MEREQKTDAVDALLTRAAMWEPPDGFVLRVIAASRVDERRVSDRLESHTRFDLFAHVRAYLRVLGARSEGAAWTVRQYWKLLRRP